MYGREVGYVIIPLLHMVRSSTHFGSDPAKVLGLEEGDAHVIRNAGGRTIEALRSLIISQQLLGTREIVIIHHVRRFLMR